MIAKGSRVRCLGLAGLILTVGSGEAMAIDIGDGLQALWTNDVRLSGIDSETLPLGTYGAGSGRGSLAGRLDWRSTLVLGDEDFGATIGEVGWWSPERGVYDIAGATLGYVTDWGAPRYREGIGPTIRHGEIELGEAVVHDRLIIAGDQSLTMRVGRDVLIWGESLYFPDNGIAGGQAPVDRRAITPTPSYGETTLFEPVGQASLVWEIQADLTFEAYDQFEYRPDRFDAIGGTVGTDSWLGPDSRVVLDPVLRYYGGASFRFGADHRPDGADQFGVALRGLGGDIDWGVYALRFDAKTPVPGFHLTGRDGAGYLIGHWDLDYASGIDLVGASASGTISGSSIAGEVSIRRNMPLATAGIVTPFAGGGGANLIPRGDTFHVQASWSQVTGPLPGFPDGATWSGELAGHGLLAVTANPGETMPGRSRWALALRTAFEPRLFQAMPGVDVTLPLSLGYDVLGRSPLDPSQNPGLGEFSIGVGAGIDAIWHVAMQGTRYLGSTRDLPVPSAALGAERVAAYGDYLSVSLERRF